MNKTQKKQIVTHLAKSLRPLTPAQREFMERDVIRHHIFYSSPARCWCSHCGKEFALSEIHAGACPHCGVKSEMKKSRANRFDDFFYSAIITTRGDWQIVRYFLIRAHVQREGYNGGKYGYTYAPSYEITEVLRKWYNPTENVSATESVNLVAFPNYRQIPYALYSDLSYCSRAQEQNDYRTEWFLKKLYPKGRILPYYAKRGMTMKNAGELDIDSFATKVDKTPYAETLLKMGYVELANSCLYDGYKWHSSEKKIRIAIRHGMDFSKIKLSDYYDYLDLLSRYKMDTMNPIYLAPADFWAEHDRLVARRERERQEEERRRKERMRLLELEREAKTKELSKKRQALWGSFVIKGYGMVFTPLLTVNDYQSEGKAMHHCVGQYADRENSLILSARMNGKRVETIEVNLTTFRVVQSRAVCNGTSEHHKEILELMDKNMSRIRKIAKSA